MTKYLVRWTEWSDKPPYEHRFARVLNYRQWQRYERLMSMSSVSSRSSRRAYDYALKVGDRHD